MLAPQIATSTRGEELGRAAGCGGACEGSDLHPARRGCRRSICEWTDDRQNRAKSQTTPAVAAWRAVPVLVWPRIWVSSRRTPARNLMSPDWSTRFKTMFLAIFAIHASNEGSLMSVVVKPALRTLQTVFLVNRWMAASSSC